MLDRIIDFLIAHVFDRAGTRELEIELRRLEANQAMIGHLNARIAEVFTPQEWADTEARCRREHPECF